METLWEISEEMETLERILEADDSSAEEDWFGEWFESLLERTNDKVDNYSGLIQMLLASAKARKEEAARLAERARVDTNSAKRLKDRLQEFLIAHDIKRLDTARYRVTVAKNGGKRPLIIPEDVSKLDKAYHKITISLDKDKIREDIDGGLKIPGCVLGERGTSLRIE